MHPRSYAAWAALALLACDPDEGPVGGARRRADASNAPPPGDAAPEPDAVVAADAAHDATAAETGPDAASPGDAGSDAAPPDPGPLNTADEALDTANLFLGTAGIGFAYAALTPAAQVPLGLVKLGPDTTFGPAHPPFHHFSGYHFGDPDVRGFSHTHFIGTGVPDYGNFRFLPVPATPEAEADPRPLFTTWMPMDKATEAASPGYYTVRLPTPGVTVELTATAVAGLQRYTFDTVGPAALLFDATSDAGGEGGARDSLVTAVEGGLDGEVFFGGSYTGRNPFHLFYSARFEPAPSRVILADAEGGHTDRPQVTGVPGGALLVWDDLPPERRVEVRTGVSFVDLDQARAHREADLDASDFDEVAAAAREAWRDKLRRVRVAGGTPELRRIFLTAQYNAYRMPTRLSGRDGRYLGFDRAVHEAVGFTYLSDLSLWDTFRTLHPWYSLTDHEAQRDSLRSLTAMGEQGGGYIPRWPAGVGYTGGMIGSSQDVVFADAAVKGVADVDYEGAYEMLRSVALAGDPPPAGQDWRDGNADYMALGYVPFEASGDCVSKTLEYAHADNALAVLARFLGRDDDAAAFGERAGNWRHLFHAETGFMYGRMRDGEWVIKRPDAHADLYTEGTAWQWTFFVPHDPAGLAEVFGGPAGFGEKLEALFAESRLGKSEGPVRNNYPDSYYWHGNEPDIHAGYFFPWTDRPERGAFWLREIQTRLYGDAPDGLAGNDDGGTLSTWFLFSALGLYPVAGTSTYILGTPLFPLAEVDLAGGGVLRVEAPGADLENRYVRAVTWNESPVAGAILDHADLAGGGVLRFEMGPSPTAGNGP